ncbi:MAG: dihydropteroate synthase [Zoogloeaceae bacterium]|jgi:dihydropteroate synthase|nr:dihydropteroate synthase [Zoogloeaceae bacterium]
MNRVLHCGRFRLDLSRPLLMGIVNLTDNSFSGDGLHGVAERAIAQGLRMVEAGAAMLDLGAESSRPGMEPVCAQQELDRLLPVLEGLRDCGVPLSVDTVKPEVMRAAIAAGADLINDIAALQASGAIGAVAESQAAVCLMHMQGGPRTMQIAPHYGDAVSEVRAFLLERVAACHAAGIASERIVIDPGFGFGKTLEHNLDLLRHLDRFVDTGLPVLAGLSRKSMLGQITGQPVGERVSASVAAALLAAQRGASIIRVHDVAATRDALAVWQAVQKGRA